MMEEKGSYPSIGRGVGGAASDLGLEVLSQTDKSHSFLKACAQLRSP